MTLEEKLESIKHLEISPDGYTLATVSRGSGKEFFFGEKLIKLWDLRSGKRMATLKGHRTDVEAVQFSPTGSVLASASSGSALNNWEIKLWDIKNQREKRTIKGSSGFIYITSLCFSPDGTTIAAALGIPGEVKLWDVQSGREKVTLKGHKGIIRSVNFSPDGFTLVSGGEKKKVKIWNVQPQKGTILLPKVEFIVSTPSYSISPEGDTFAIHGNQYGIDLWDVKTGDLRKTLPQPLGWTNAMCFRPDGQVLATATTKKINLWEIHSGTVIRTLETGIEKTHSIRFSRDGQTIAITDGGKAIQLWDVNSGQRKSMLNGHKSPVQSIHFSPDGRTLVSGGGAKIGTTGDALGDVLVWDAKSGEKLGAVLQDSPFAVGFVRFSPDSNTLAVVIQNMSVLNPNTAPEIKIWDMRSKKVKTVLTGRIGIQFRSIRFSPDGKLMACQYFDNLSKNSGVKFWDVLTWQEKADFSIPFGVYELCSNANSMLIFSGYTNIWDARPKREVGWLVGHEDDVVSTTFSQDSKILKSIDKSGKVIYWELKTGQPLLIEPEDEFKSASGLSPNKKVQAKIKNKRILIVDLTIPKDPDKNPKHTDPRFLAICHEIEGGKVFTNKNYWFSGAFHQKRFADAHPFDAKARMSESLAWVRAAQQEEWDRTKSFLYKRAVLTYVRALLLDPSVGDQFFFLGG